MKTQDDLSAKQLMKEKYNRLSGNCGMLALALFLGGAVTANGTLFIAGVFVFIVFSVGFKIWST